MFIKKGVFMTKVFTYVSKRLLFVALMVMSSFAAAQESTREVQLRQEEVTAIISSEKAFVFVGEEASSTLTTIRTILDLADNHDAVPNMRSIIERAEQGFKTALKEVVIEALAKEAPALLERHHAKVQHDDQLKGLARDLDAACELFSSDALTISVEPTRSAGDETDVDADDAERGCGKAETFCRLTVNGPATIRSLTVTGDEVVNGNVRIGGTLTVGGNTILSNLTVTGSFNVLGVTNAYVQGGNSFGATGELGLNDFNTLNIRTNALDRMQISPFGGVNIVAPDVGLPALVINANSAGAALLVNGGSGFPFAAAVVPGLNQIGLGIGDSGTQPSLVVSGTAVVNNGANSTYPAFPTTLIYPLFAGGTQVAQSTYTPAVGETNTFFSGMPRMIWANIASAGSAITFVNQSGGITAATLTSPGVYTITYAGFATGEVPIVVATSFGVSPFYVAQTAISDTSVTLLVSDDTGTPQDALNLSVLIMGRAS